MILNAEQEEYLPFITPSAGLIVNIHSPDNIPWARESGIVVSPGFNTEIAVEIVSVTTLRDTYTISIYCNGIQILLEIQPKLEQLRFILCMYGWFDLNE